MKTYDVVVVGAGPVGLMLACELGLHGVSTLVVERLTEPSTTVKAGSINVPTAEAFHRRGMLGQLAEVQDEVFAMVAQFSRQATGNGAQPPKNRGAHFAGLTGLDPARLKESDQDCPSGPAAGVFLVPQQAVESILAARAGELGAQLWRGRHVLGFEQDGAGVTVELDGGERVRAHWLVGCDGGRSTVRKLAGFDFPGTDGTITGHQAVVGITDPEKLPVGWNHLPGGVLVHGPTPGRILTVEFDGAPGDRDAEITREELQASLRAVSGTDVTVTDVTSATRFTDNARQASSYRIGRVLLAGDAAHVHAPFGGQGLNLGVQDAVNLGWKLAATVNGWAPEGLLDTYTTERHPVGAQILQWNRAQVALMRPDRHAGALREVVTDLMGTDDGNAYFIKRLAGVGIRYDLGGGHPLTGRLAPDLALDDGTRTADHCHDGRALLLDLTPDGRLVRELGGGSGDRVRGVVAGCAARPELAGLLIRPDGYVAWAADISDMPHIDQDPDGLREALARWFGVETADAAAMRVAGAVA